MERDFSLNVLLDIFPLIYGEVEETHFIDCGWND
jgi:hypothetical protein